mgnify:CR=1 FL=1
MTKAEIMEAANVLIEELMYCGDGNFVDRVTWAVMNGLEFTEAEIEEEE